MAAHSGWLAIRPRAENGYQACRSAEEETPVLSGNVGAGTGVTVGKWAGTEYAMKGGLGSAEISIGRAWVSAVVVINSVGDIIDEHGSIIAGAYSEEAGFLAQNNPRARWKMPEIGLGQSTVLSIVMTNIKLDKLQTYILAKRAHNGYARAIIPANTSFDGDIVFAVCSGEIDFEPEIAYDIAAEVIRQAIVRGVT